jgi:hypothetical protein
MAPAGQVGAVWSVQLQAHAVDVLGPSLTSICVNWPGQAVVWLLCSPTSVQPLGTT